MKTVSMPEAQMRILSLGAGVQSTTVLLMSCHGDLPNLDAAVFADTGWEPQSVYDHLRWLTAEAGKYGIPVYTVSNGNIKEDALRYQMNYAGKESCRQLQKGITKENKSRWGSMPYFILGPNAEKGMIRRQCTREYKITPIRRKVRELAGYAPRQRIPIYTVEQWIGISADEAKRQRGSGESWWVSRHPLLEKNITRLMCYEWLESHGYRVPTRSACIGCPYRSDAEWRWLRDNEPGSWADAIMFDRAIRDCGGMRGAVFLHAQRIPLEKVDLRSDVDFGQGLLFDTLCPSCMT